MAVKEKPAAKSNGNTEREYEKAKGFLNINLKLKSGETARLGSIPLRESNDLENQIAEFLKDPATRDAGIARLIAEKLAISYAPTRSAEELQLDL